MDINNNKFIIHYYSDNCSIIKTVIVRVDVVGGAVSSTVFHVEAPYTKAYISYNQALKSLYKEDF